MPPSEDNERMKWGRRLEDDVLEAAGEYLETYVEPCPLMLRSLRWPWLTCNLDGLVEEDNTIIPIEAKTSERGDGWKGDEIPDSAHLQMMTQLGIIGAPYGYIAVLIGMSEFRVHKIERDDAIITMIAESAKDFWGLIKNETPPLTELNLEVVKALNKRATKETVLLPQQMLHHCNYLVNLKALAKRVEQEIENQQAQLCANLGPHARGECGEFVLAWPEVTTNRLDTKALKAEMPEVFKKYSKATTSRRFTIKETIENGEEQRSIKAESFIGSFRGIGFSGSNEVGDSSVDSETGM